MRFTTFCFMSILLLLTSYSFSQKLTREQRIKVEALIVEMNAATDPKDVIKFTEKILKIDDSNIQAIAYRAYANYLEKNYSQSLKDYDFCIKAKPFSSVYVYRGWLKASMGDTIGALEDAEMALSLSADDPMISKEIATLYKNIGNVETATRYYETAIKLAPNNYSAYASLAYLKKTKGDLIGAAENYSGAIKAIDNKLLFDRYEYDWLYRQKAELDFRLGKYDDAVVAITQAMLLNPENTTYYSLRIKFYKALGEFEKACIDINELKKIDKKNKTYYVKVECDTNKKYEPSEDWLKSIIAENFYKQARSIEGDSVQKEKSISLYTKILEQKPNHVYALANRGAVYDDLGQFDKSLVDFDKVAKLLPKSPHSFYYRALVKRDLEDYSGAIKDAGIAISLDSTNTLYWVIRASIKTDSGDTLAAIADLTQALKINKYYAKAYIERGSLEMYAKKDYEAALKDFLKAIEIQENSPMLLKKANYYSYCAEAYDKLGQYDRAIVEIEKAIAIKPESGFYYYMCGEIKARMKNMEGACKEWTKAKDLGYNRADETLLYNCQPEDK